VFKSPRKKTNKSSKASAIESTTQENQFDAGIEAFDKQNYTLAINCFTNALDDPNANFTLIYYNRGLAYLKKRQYEKAISDFEEIKDRGCSRIYFYLGQAYLKLKVYDKAIEYLTFHLRQDRTDVDGNNMLGIAYLAKNDQEKACGFFLSSLLSDSRDNAVAYENLNTIDKELIVSQIEKYPPQSREYLREKYLQLAPTKPAPVQETTTYNVLQHLYQQPAKDEKQYSQSSDEQHSQTSDEEKEKNNLTIEAPVPYQATIEHDDATEVAKFKQAYEAQYDSETFTNPFSSMRRNIDLFTTMAQIRKYADDDPTSRTATVLENMNKPKFI